MQRAGPAAPQGGPREMGAGSGHRLQPLPWSSGPEEGGALFISEGLVREPEAEGLSWTSLDASEGAVARRALLLPRVLAVDWLRPVLPSGGQAPALPPLLHCDCEALLAVCAPAPRT